MASDKKNNSNKHDCPRIHPDWSMKITGPAWRGESADQARTMWSAHLRRLAAHVRPMPRTTNKAPRH